jgi:hypothetical protein
VRTLVLAIQGDVAPAGKRHASRFRQATAQGGKDGTEVIPSMPAPRAHGQGNEIANLLRNLFLTRVCDALHSIAESLPVDSAYDAASDRASSSCGSDCTCADGDTDASGMDTLSRMSGAPLHQRTWAMVRESADLLHWICHRRHLPATLRECCEARSLIGVLASLCRHAPAEDGAVILSLMHALRTLVVGPGASEDMRALRIKELTAAGWVATVSRGLPFWIRSLLACQGGVQRGSPFYNDKIRR